VAFPKKYDASGRYVRHFLPALRRVPDKYIYEPWKMPAEVQKTAGCVIGVDYPAPVLDHDVASKANMDRMKLAFAAAKAKGGAAPEGDEEAGPAVKKPRGGAK
jgi:cryptochrome